ncbi:hypothetical protein ACH5AJ_14830 [Streptomyces rochei]|uniref:hypothetical protein n=1 Tax=Streptomyces rochei TaxID=1928 RepID=UPI0037BCB23F
MKGDRLFALLLSVLGLRPAGVCCLRWSDIDLDAATLSIANTRIVMGRRTVVEKDTKRMAGERMLPLPSLVREALKRFRATQAVDAWRWVRGASAAGMRSWMNLGAR